MRKRITHSSNLCCLLPLKNFFPSSVSCSCSSSSLLYIPLLYLPPAPYGHNSLYTFLYLYFHLRNCSYNILLLLPFKYPIKFHTLILGSISTSICICSGYTFAFIYFVHSHPVLNISTITLLFW